LIPNKRNPNTSIVGPKRVGVSLLHTHGLSTGSEPIHSSHSAVNLSKRIKILMIKAKISDKNLAILKVLSKSIGIFVSRN